MALNTIDRYVYDYNLFIESYAKFTNAKTIVEVGVQSGFTAVKLVSAARLNSGKYFGYDYWGDIGVYIGDPTTQQDIEELLKREGYNESEFKLTTIDTTTEEFNKVLLEDTAGKIDLAFIDADHSYLGVKNDFEKIYPLLSEDGTLILHDTYSHTGCRKFIIDLYTKYQDGTFDFINLPFGGGDRRFGLTILTKRSYPLYQDGIWYSAHERHGLTNEQVYDEEKNWYLTQLNKHK